MGAAAGALPAMLSPLLGSERAGQITPALNAALKRLKDGGYQNTRADLMRAISESGISKQRLASMVGLLDTPLASGVLNKLSPGLCGELKSLGREICGGNNAVQSGGLTKFPPLKKR